MSPTDALTGLPGRSDFDSELARLTQVGEPFSLLLLDLDNFKAVNGRGLVEQGDRLLRRTGQAILAVSPEGATVFRRGGDEFAVLVATAATGEAVELGERISAAVAAIEVPESDDPPGLSHLACSIGVARYPADGQTADDIVRVADRSLYWVKRAARGGVATATHQAMHVYLETERLILRRFTSDDVDLVTALDADPAVMRYINGGRPTPRDEIRDDYLPSWLAYYERGDRYGFWAAIQKRTGAFLGWFHLRPLPEDPDDEPELGYRLIATAWGQGYATEGSRALIGKAFGELAVRRVYATTMVVNVGSWRVMEKAGLRHVRTFHQAWPDRIEGEEHGDVEYALTREEWEARRNPRA